MFAIVVDISVPPPQIQVVWTAEIKGLIHDIAMSHEPQESDVELRIYRVPIHEIPEEDSALEIFNKQLVNKELEKFKYDAARAIGNYREGTYTVTVVDWSSFNILRITSGRAAEYIPFNFSGNL